MLEVVLALALFAAVSTAMAVALSQLAASTTAARRESMLLRRLESELAETAHQPRLLLGRSESPAADASGISVSREVSRFDAVSQTGAALDGIYRIRVSAWLSTGPGAGDRLVREMETFEIRFGEIHAAQAAGAVRGAAAAREELPAGGGRPQ